MKHWMVLLLSIGCLPVFGETLTWQAVAGRVTQHESVVLSTALLGIARADLDADAAWGGVKLSARPVADLTKADLGVDLLFPLGTAAEREKTTVLAEVYALRSREAEESIAQATLDLYRGYVAAYVAQQAVGVAQAAHSEEKARLEAVLQRVKQGTLTSTAGALAEAALQDAEANLEQARLDLRLAWFSLAFQANLETPRPEHQPGSQDPLGLVPVLAKPDTGVLAALGQPVELIASAKLNSSVALAQRQKVARAERALAAASDLPLTFAPQLSFTGTQGSAALTYNSATGTVGLGGDLALYRADDLAVKTADPVVSASVLLTLELSGDTAARRKSLADALELENRRLGYLEATLELAVRSKYASYLKAQESLAASERALVSALAATDSFASKKLIGQVSPEDEAANAAVLVRATFNHDKAVVNLTLAQFDLREAASAWENT